MPFIADRHRQVQPSPDIRALDSLGRDLIESRFHPAKFELPHKNLSDLCELISFAPFPVTVTLEALSTRTGEDDRDLKSTPRRRRVSRCAMLVFHFKQIDVTGLPAILIIKYKIGEWRHLKL